MRRVKSDRKWCWVFLVLVFCLTGCGDGGRLRGEADTGKSETEKRTQQQFSMPEEAAGNEKLEYDRYLRKIWILEGHDTNTPPFTFVITKIENGYIEGKLANHVNVATYYFDSTEYGKNAVDFSGTIRFGHGKCQFENMGKKGVIKFVFGRENRVKATLEYLDGKPDIYEDIEVEGSYWFRPYILEDLDLADVGIYFIASENEKLSFETYLDSWGKVNVVSGIFASDKPYPQIFLTNDKEEILYEFFAPYQTPSEVLDIQIGDLNGDGLKDVKIITYFPIAPDDYRFEWAFCQMENGLFYRDERYEEWKTVD